MHPEYNRLEEDIKAFLNVGSGSGSGYGSGYGSGDGSGSGYGSGDGVKKINSQFVHRIDGVQTVITHVHGDIARGAILRDDLQLKPCYIAKGHGLFAHGDTIEEAQAALEEKILDDLPVEEKIGEFKKKFCPGVKYPAMEFYNWHHFLTGSCEMGRKNFAAEHDISLDSDEMTPEEFMELTKDDFGGSVIRQLMEEWKDQ